ncbi:hypothetical protein J437_LFUL009117 [Ladona fulva]|uniref:Uncharacterized protein n=1 Tax=Ladona fulva TaxID=123851 RepID=A0A8K0K8S6_LADFU|nr:hypothetical protein J437_LFUL009117 [Ladona fulva]
MWFSQRDSLSHYFGLLWSELVSKLHFVEWTLLDDSVRSEVSEFAYVKFNRLKKKLDKLCADQLPIRYTSDVSAPDSAMDRYTQEDKEAFDMADCEVDLQHESDSIKINFASVIRKWYEPLKDRLKVSFAYKFLNEHNLVVVKAHKGKCTVVLSRDDYNSKCFDFIQGNYVEELRKDPTPSYKKHLKEVLSSIKYVFSPNEKFHLVSMNPQPAATKTLRSSEIT